MESLAICMHSAHTFVHFARRPFDSILSFLFAFSSFVHFFFIQPISFLWVFISPDTTLSFNRDFLSRVRTDEILNCCRTLLFIPLVFNVLSPFLSLSSSGFIRFSSLTIPRHYCKFTVQLWKQLSGAVVSVHATSHSGENENARNFRRKHGN